jgi:hypothetical protein
MGKTNLSIGRLRVQNSDHWPQNGKQMQCAVCLAEDKLGKIGNCPESKVVFCVDSDKI